MIRKKSFSAGRGKCLRLESLEPRLTMAVGPIGTGLGAALGYLPANWNGLGTELGQVTDQVAGEIDRIRQQLIQAGDQVRKALQPVAVKVTVKALASDGSVAAPKTDPNLQGSCGAAVGSLGQVWVANAASGKVTSHDWTGRSLPTVVDVLQSDGMTSATPTAIAANTAPRLFKLQNGQRSEFLVATEEGTIAAYGASLTDGLAETRVDNTGAAIYKGLAIATVGRQTYLYATNLATGTIDAFDSAFQPATLTGDFTDPTLPEGFVPYGIQTILNRIYVTYVNIDPATGEIVPGAGNGQISVFKTDGQFVRTLVAAGAATLDTPTCLVVSPFKVGRISNALLVGNAGNGTVTAYDPVAGRYVGYLTDSTGAPLQVNGLSAMVAPLRGKLMSPKNTTTVFTAGFGGDSGLLGQITPTGK